MPDEVRRADTRSGKHARNAGVVGGLAPLDDLPDFKVAEGDPDVRGWDVEAADGEKIGEVHDLIVDVAAMKVRYLDIDVDNAVLDTEDDRHILVPVGCARLSDDQDDVRLTTVNTADLATIPGFAHEPITRDFESSIRNCYTALATAGASGGGSTTRAGKAPSRAGTADASAVGATAAAGRPEADSFYGHDHFDDGSFFGRRRLGRERTPYIIRSEGRMAVGERPAQAGEVPVTRRVEAEQVTRRAPVSPDDVAVERRPAPPGMTAGPHAGENEVRIPVTDEQAGARKKRADGQPEERGSGP